MDIADEIKFKTARSGGKGGQNVNKVETMVEGYWSIERSLLFDEMQKALINKILINKITSEGFLLVKSQTERSQLGNKLEVIRKINLLVTKALIVQKKRRPTKPGKAAKERRITSKKKVGETKLNRMKFKAD